LKHEIITGIVMPRILVVYHSRTGNTAKMADAIADGAKSSGAEVKVKRSEEASLEDLLGADAIIIGSPTYYGLMASEIKSLFDKSSDIRGQLESKIGAAFTSSGSAFGGNQTALLSIIQAMLIHGMVVMGDPMETGGHYGVIAVGDPDFDVLKTCEKLGARAAFLAGKLWG
jgi:NAD(P)H dehydrogenase (quinone)